MDDRAEPRASSSAALSAKPKSILKRPSVNLEGKEPKLHWDEDNIQLTESQKNSTMKINEPKTPYIHYNQETDEIMSDLTTIPGIQLGSSSVSPVGSVGSTSSAHFQDGDGEWESGESESDEATREKRKRFAKLRAKHYNMREAIKIGHKLVEAELSDDADNVDDDDEEEDTKSNDENMPPKLDGDFMET